MDGSLPPPFRGRATPCGVSARAVTGYGIPYSGPLTQIPLSEATLNGAIDFRVGSPWGKTALVTGWGSNDQKFTSNSLGNTENYYTSSYIGLTRRFSTRLNIEA